MFVLILYSDKENEYWVGANTVAIFDQDKYDSEYGYPDDSVCYIYVEK